jgi:hypothetical protein
VPIHLQRISREVTQDRNPHPPLSAVRAKSLATTWATAQPSQEVLQTAVYTVRSEKDVRYAEYIDHRKLKNTGC